MKRSLQRFLQKRKARAGTAWPYDSQLATGPFCRSNPDYSCAARSSQIAQVVKLHLFMFDYTVIDSIDRGPNTQYIS